MALIYDGEVRIQKLTLGSYQTNCYVVACPKTKEAVVIDAPAEPEAITYAARGLNVRLIVITHRHQDHTQALPRLKELLTAPVAAHPLDATAIGIPASRLLEHGDKVTFGDITLDVLHTPGHTPGSICLHYGRHLFCGDTLFPGGPGHTRTPDDLATVLASIRTRLLPLPDDMALYPGHGEGDTLGRIRPAIVAFLARPLPSGLCGDVTWEMK